MREPVDNRPSVVQPSVSCDTSAQNPLAVARVTVRQTPCTATLSPTCKRLRSSSCASIAISTSLPRGVTPATRPIECTMPVNNCRSSLLSRDGNYAQVLAEVLQIGVAPSRAVIHAADRRYLHERPRIRAQHPRRNVEHKLIDQALGNERTREARSRLHPDFVDAALGEEGQQCGQVDAGTGKRQFMHGGAGRRRRSRLPAADAQPALTGWRQDSGARRRASATVEYHPQGLARLAFVRRDPDIGRGSSASTVPTPVTITELRAR